EAHLVAADFDHGHRDVIIDDDALVLLAGQNQHRRSSLRPISGGGGPYISEVSLLAAEMSCPAPRPESTPDPACSIIQLYVRPPFGQVSLGIFTGHTLDAWGVKLGKMVKKIVLNRVFRTGSSSPPG